MKEILLGRDDLVGRWVMWKCDNAPDQWRPGQGAGIGLTEDGDLIAGVLYEQYNGASVMTHIGAVDNATWLCRKYLWTIFDYPFNQLKVRKILAPVGPTNKRSQRFVEHLGFTLESVIPEAHPDGDLLIYTMTKAQCRWLTLKDRHGQAKGTAAT